MKRIASLGIAASVLTLTLSACERGPVSPSEQHASMHRHFSTVSSGELSGLAKAVRQGTARFHSTVQATMAGYAEASPCVAVPGLGGMGFHWVNGGLVDPVFDAANPEAVLYELKANGQYKLVAVEYIVIDVGQTAPTFDGHAFDVGGAPVPVAHWTLHVWLHKENPSGLFAPFNPELVCN